jgi:hypothetical protein
MTHVSRDAMTCDAYKRDALSHSLSSLSSSSDAATLSGDAAFSEDELNGVWVCAQRHALSGLMFLVRQHSVPLPLSFLILYIYTHTHMSRASMHACISLSLSLYLSLSLSIYIYIRHI